MKHKLSCFLLCLCMIFPIFSSAQSAQTVQAAQGNSKIHFLTLPESTLAVLVENNGRFGMIDSGEGYSYPDGSNPRYPVRGNPSSYPGFDDEVISYLKSVGVTSDNFEFYIGTHPHSDHIGTADTVIREFHPKRVYCPEYKDIYIDNYTHLWDNLFVYDNMITAAKEVGSSIILNFDPNAPLYPELINISGSGTLFSITSENEEDSEEENNVEPALFNYTVTLTNPVTGETLTQEITPDLSGSYSYSFSGLPKYDNNRNEIPYEVKLNYQTLDYEITDYVPGELGASPR